MSSTRPWFFIFFIMTFCIFPSLSLADADSPAAEFVIDFSESMNDTIGSMKKADIARTIVDAVLDSPQLPARTGVTLLGHREKNKLDDIEYLLIDGKRVDVQMINKKIAGAVPQGGASLPLALKNVVAGLGERDTLNIFILTDGRKKQDEELLKTVREIKDRYDFRVIIHVIDLTPTGFMMQVAAVAYGNYYRIASNNEISAKTLSNNTGTDRQLSELIAATIRDLKKIMLEPSYQPRIISNDDMVLIPEGEFKMGGDFELDEPSERPAHTVFLDAFYIDRFEVTQRQFRTIMGNNPSYWIGSDMPVVNVSWFDAKEYCEKVGKRPPTEAEWEKAAKGKEGDRWPGTNKKENLADYAWLDDLNIGPGRSGSRIHPVGQKKPNGYGIFDMSGNAFEWVADWYSWVYYKTSPRENPKGPDKGQVKVLKGGSWDSHWFESRVSYRYNSPPDVRYVNNGFRCVKSVH